MVKIPQPQLGQFTLALGSRRISQTAEIQILGLKPATTTTPAVVCFVREVEGPLCLTTGQVSTSATCNLRSVEPVGLMEDRLSSPSLATECLRTQCETVFAKQGEP
jgi:hypothetical protein